MAELTKRQKLFVREYIADLNATQAYIRAGYSAKTANVCGPRLLSNVSVAAAVQAAKEAREYRTEVTADRVIKELARLAFSDTRKLFDGDGTPLDITDLDDDTAACITGVDVQQIKLGDGSDDSVAQVKKIRMADKVRALELLSKHLGLLTDKVQISGDADKPFRVDIRVVD